VTRRFRGATANLTLWRREKSLCPVWNRIIKMLGCRGQLKCERTGAETIFRLSAKRTSPFKSAGGRQFSRLLAADVCASAVVMLGTPCSEVVWRLLATHSIRQFPLHFPSRASPCAITFQLQSTGCTLLLVLLIVHNEAHDRALYIVHLLITLHSNVVTKLTTYQQKSYFEVQ